MGYVNFLEGIPLIQEAFSGFGISLYRPNLGVEMLGCACAIWISGCGTSVLWEKWKAEAGGCKRGRIRCQILVQQVLNVSQQECV